VRESLSRYDDVGGENGELAKIEMGYWFWFNVRSRTERRRGEKKGPAAGDRGAKEEEEARKK